MTNFLSQTREELIRALDGLGISHNHSKLLFNQVYRGLKRSPADSPGLSKKGKDRLRNLLVQTPKIKSLKTSKEDQSIKIIVALGDGKLVETVLMPENSRLTLCLSSQVGCAQRCTFCHTGRMGLARNLTVGEIVGQVFLINELL